MPLRNDSCLVVWLNSLRSQVQLGRTLLQSPHGVISPGISSSSMSNAIEMSTLADSNRGVLAYVPVRTAFLNCLTTCRARAADAFLQKTPTCGPDSLSARNV